MFQSAVSWAISPAMLANSFNVEIERRGNTHRFFAPVSVYPTINGEVYLAVGNDQQWEAITKAKGFESLGEEQYIHNEGRILDVNNLNQKIAKITSAHATKELVKQFQSIGVPISPVNSLQAVCQDPLISDKLIHSFDPVSGKEITIPPPPVISEYLNNKNMRLDFPPRLGEDNHEVYGSLGINIDELKTLGVI